MRPRPFIFIALLTALLFGCASGPMPVSTNAAQLGGYSMAHDYRGSTIALSAGNGLVTDRMEYSLYGLTTYRAGTNDTPFLFNGKYGVMTDANGLLYMRARYYNPYLCRFASADPAGFGGGLNQYAYANGNPVSLIDPFGLGAMGELTGSSLSFKMNDHYLIDQYFSQETVTFDDIVYGLLGLAGDVLSMPWDMAYGTAGNINTTISGQDNEGNDVSGWSRAWAGAQVAMIFVPIGDVAESLNAAETPIVYSVAFETQLDVAQFGLKQEQHFQIANEALQAEQAVNPALAEMVPAPTRWGRPPTGWTWQHATIEQGGGRAGVMQLVPRTQHTPGSPFWPLFHPLPGGAGGYSQWAIPAGAPPR